MTRLLPTATYSRGILNLCLCLCAMQSEAEVSTEKQILKKGLPKAISLWTDCYGQMFFRPCRGRYFGACALVFWELQGDWAVNRISKINFPLNQSVSRFP